MSKTRQLLTVASLLTLFLLLSGCSNGQDQGNSNSNKKIQKFVNRANSTSTPEKIDLPTATAADLTVGKTVLVFGSAGDAGEISATRIIVGALDKLESFFKPNNGQGGQRPSTTIAFNNDRESTNDSSLADKKTAGSFAPTGDRQTRTMANSDGSFKFSKIEKIIGEIVKNDGSSLTVKLNAGGSKVIFYSAKTFIYTVATTTTTIQK